jgi:hypothetical protein
MIELQNYTPFPHMTFEKYGVYGALFDVIVFRGTFRLKGGGLLADLAEDQRPLVMADEYHDDPQTSSLKFETDLVLYKKQTDIHVIGLAHAEKERPVTGWVASISVGNFTKSLHIHGPCQWEYHHNSWQLTPPKSISQIPLRYEYAFGGCWIDVDGTEQVFQQNPVGRGYYPDINQLDTSSSYFAPQIDDGQFAALAYTSVPQGLGPMSRWWDPRLKFAGTYDDAWRSSRFPLLPDDFDVQFYQSAHPEMRYPGFLSGRKPILLKGLLPESPRILTALPEYKPVCVLTDGKNHNHTLAPNLDTLTFDLDERLIHATWRLTIPRSLNFREGVLGCIVPAMTKGACYGG